MSFESPELEPLPVDLKMGKKKSPTPKDKKAMADARAFAAFGVQVLRVKAKTLAALGKEAEQCGIKQIGHGKILLASDNAETAISKLGGIVDDLLTESEKPDYGLVLDIIRLQKEFNSQLIATAQAHFAVDKQPSAEPTGKHISIPYPSGAAIMLGVGNTKPSIEGAGNGG